MNRLGVGIVMAALAGAGLGACGAAPEPRLSGPRPAPSAAPGDSGSPLLPAECDERPGKPAPAPLERSYTGVAAAARCQGEVYTIMSGVSHSLGVQCEYCHLVPDYRAMTHRKQIANWMATALVPALHEKGSAK
ncbi:MAG TPA: hypothetical protein VGC79_34555, partial [Polyangiaceae bacterium]